MCVALRIRETLCKHLLPRVEVAKSHVSPLVWIKLMSWWLDRPLCNVQSTGRIKRMHAQKIMVAEMKMIGWICGHTRKDKVRNEVIHEKVEVASYKGQDAGSKVVMVQIRQETSLVRRCERITLREAKRG